MRTTLNLFPLWMQQQQRRRRQNQWLAVVQVAVFLLLGLVMYIAGNIERREADRSAALASRLAAFDPAPMLAAEAIRAAAEMYNITVDFLDARVPISFDPDWLEAVINAVPDGVSLSLVTFAEEGILLSAVAAGLPDITTHRLILRETGFFGSILLGQVVRLNDGRVGYDLRLEAVLP